MRLLILTILLVLSCGDDTQDLEPDFDGGEEIDGSAEDASSPMDARPPRDAIVYEPEDSAVACTGIRAIIRDFKGGGNDGHVDFETYSGSGANRCVV